MSWPTDLWLPGQSVAVSSLLLVVPEPLPKGLAAAERVCWGLQEGRSDRVEFSYANTLGNITAGRGLRGGYECPAGLSS